MNKIIVFLFLFFFYCSNVNAFVNMDDKAIEKAQEYGMMNYQKELPDFAKPWLIYEERSASLDTFGEKVYLYTPYYLVSVNARERLLASQSINLADGKLILDAYKDSLPVCAVLYMKDTTSIKTDLVGLLRQKGELLESYAMDIQDIAIVQTMTVREEVEVDSPDEGVQLTDNKEFDGAKKEKQDDKDKIADKDKDTVKKDKKKDNEAKADKKDSDKERAKDTEKTVEKVPKIIYIEKTVPALYRVQVFFYFDMRHINLSNQATLIIDYPKDSERRFNFSFASIN